MCLQLDVASSGHTYFHVFFAVFHAYGRLVGWTIGVLQLRIILLLLFQQRLRSRFEAPMPDASQNQHQRGGWWDQEQQNSYKMQPADIEESMEEHGFMVSCLVTSS